MVEDDPLTGDCISNHNFHIISLCADAWTPAYTNIVSRLFCLFSSEILKILTINCEITFSDDRPAILPNTALAAL